MQYTVGSVFFPGPSYVMETQNILHDTHHDVRKTRSENLDFQLLKVDLRRVRFSFEPGKCPFFLQNIFSKPPNSSLGVLSVKNGTSMDCNKNLTPL